MRSRRGVRSVARRASEGSARARTEVASVGVGRVDLSLDDLLLCRLEALLERGLELAGPVHPCRGVWWGSGVERDESEREAQARAGEWRVVETRREEGERRGGVDPSS